MPPAMKVDEVELNYVFVPGGGCPPPGAGLPSPLPVSVPESLLHRPSAHLRASIIGSLRGEGIQVEQAELRFWKPKRPLKASNVVSDLSTWFLGTGDGERGFIAVALTESAFTSLGEGIGDQSLVHLVVTRGKAPYIVEPSSPGPPNASLNLPLTITIGTEAFPKHGKAEKGERYNHDVSIAKASSASKDVTGGVPPVLLGICALDANSDGGTIQLISHVSNLHPDGFRMYVDSGKDNTLYIVLLSWMAISVQFSDPNKAVAHAQVSWMAFPYGGTADLQLACGEINMEDGTQVDEGSTFALGSRHSLKGWQGNLTFAEKFTSPPQVFSAFTSFDVQGVTMRLTSSLENITEEGMGWKIGTWMDTVPHSATLAYLAIGRR